MKLINASSLIAFVAFFSCKHTKVGGSSLASGLHLHARYDELREKFKTAAHFSEGQTIIKKNSIWKCARAYSDLQELTFRFQVEDNGTFSREIRYVNGVYGKIGSPAGFMDSRGGQTELVERYRHGKGINPQDLELPTGFLTYRHMSQNGGVSKLLMEETCFKSFSEEDYITGQCGIGIFSILKPAYNTFTSDSSYTLLGKFYYECAKVN